MADAAEDARGSSTKKPTRGGARSRGIGDNSQAASEKAGPGSSRDVTFFDQLNIAKAAVLEFDCAMVESSVRRTPVEPRRVGGDL